jgi:ABC-type nickel/cobalt efflux system permease component RcnA
MTAVRRVLAVIAVSAAAVLAGPAGSASAHPLGNFTVNTYSGILIRPQVLEVRYVLDLAEIPTFQERSEIDADGDGATEAHERSAWAAGRAEAIRGGLSLQIGGERVPLVLEESRMALLPGQAGLDVLRLEATLRAAVPRAGTAVFRDANDRGRIGWREISAAGTDGMAVTASTVPTASISGALQSYPDDLLSAPVDVRVARFTFGPGDQAAGGAATGSDSDRRPGGDLLAALVARPSLSPTAVLLAMLAAFGVGVLHAMAPGHGKTVAAAYLGGTAGTAREAVGVGVAVSAMHTVSVVGLATVVFLAERVVPAERLYPWLGLAAGLTAVGLGGALLLARVRSREHGHDHPNPLSRRGVAAVALSGGLLPSPSALLVLIAAAALGRLALGLGLVAAFGLGLATAIAAVGVLAVRARDAVARRSWGRLARVLPIGGAAVILLMGLVLTGRAVSQL